MKKKIYKTPSIVHSEERGWLPVVSAVGFVAGAAIGKRVVNAVSNAIKGSYIKSYPSLLVLERSYNNDF